ncbi:hypothetical protein ACLOJK_035112 [Asimina triloba]
MDDYKIVASGFEMGDDRSGMEACSSATEETSLPRVAAVIDVGLRPRRIWDGLNATIIMDDLDGPTGYSLLVGFDGMKLPLSSSSSTHAGGAAGSTTSGGCGGIGAASPRAAMAAALDGDGGAPYPVLHGVLSFGKHAA